MKKMIIWSALAWSACWTAARGEPVSNRGQEAFLRNQVYAEMQRVGGQIDVLQGNLDQLERRVGNMEGGKGEIGGVKRDIEALRADLASVRREMANMRAEITEDLTKKIQTIMKSVRASAAATPPAPPPPPPVNCSKYTVQSGDTLSLIAQAFKTTVSQVKSLNHLKSDNLRVGQELLVPSPKH